ncbi:MAG: hypothetical protein AAFO63_03505 [Pseudomonadota bacterium]
MRDIRIRQLVFASNAREDIDRLQSVLGLGVPFDDPGVGVFGLVNGVFAIGDQFLEVVVPKQEDTPAGRFLDRNPERGGYMAIFQVPDLGPVRAHADANQLRRVWDIDHDEISASHFHPADIGGAIVSIDAPRPAKSWLWGGPGWRERSVPGRLIGATLIANDPSLLAARWAKLLGASVDEAGAERFKIPLADGDIIVEPGEKDLLIGFDVALPQPELALQRARDAGFAVEGSVIRMMGVDVRLSAD